MTPAIANLIREAKTFQIPGMLQVGKKHGMQTLDDAIMDLLNKKMISSGRCLLAVHRQGKIPAVSEESSRRNGSRPRGDTMTKAELDYILGTMLDSHETCRISTSRRIKQLQVESSGELLPVAFDPPIEKLTPFQTETIALHIINRNRRLTDDLVRNGSCDCSYSLGHEGSLSREHFHAARPLLDHSAKAHHRDPER